MGDGHTVWWSRRWWWSQECTHYSLLTTQDQLPPSAHEHSGIQLFSPSSQVIELSSDDDEKQPRPSSEVNEVDVCGGGGVRGKCVVCVVGGGAILVLTLSNSPPLSHSLLFF